MRCYLYSLIPIFLVVCLTLGGYGCNGNSTGYPAGTGVTIIVHGWDPGGFEPIWMTAMQNAIIDRSGNTGKTGQITVSGQKGNLKATCTSWDFSAEEAVEIVIKVDWSEIANHLTTGITAQEVAAVIAPKIYKGQNGYAPLSNLPIHLIGHSRGGGMVYELARLLGEKGITVDHLTSLDPHPLTELDPQGLDLPGEPGKIIDTSIILHDNIVFADNYWQDISWPKGEEVEGAYNRLWSLSEGQTSLPGGYHNEAGYEYLIPGFGIYNFSDHLNIILMYHGTIDLDTPVFNGNAILTHEERRIWFNDEEEEGAKTGFYFSRIAVDKNNFN